jgi:prepilin-type N-terminal cleavage/methylation domain-containing protein
MNRQAKNNSGFSLIEVVIAAVLLSMVVIVVCTLSTRSLTAVKNNREYEFAWELLDNQLTLIDSVGIEDFIEAGQLSGSFGEEENNETGHHWQVWITEKEADNLYRVDVTVSWAHGSVSAATVLNGKGLLADVNTDGDDG